MEQQAFTNIETLVKQGTKDRLRAVLLTATAAALGFLPMAVSTNVGAEVQRPLATVVVGGLITATLLTLLVLPVLYTLVYKNLHKKSVGSGKASKALVTGLVIFSSFYITKVNAQERILTLDSLEILAMENNSELKAIELEQLREDALKGAAWNFDKTEIYYHYDQNNLAINGRPIEVYGVQQNFLFPTVYTSQRKVQQARAQKSSYQYELKKNTLIRDLKLAWYQYQVAREEQYIYARLDSLYQKFAYAAERRFELGETNYLEKITARSKQQQINIKLKTATSETQIRKNRISSLVQATDSFTLALEKPVKIPYLPSDSLVSPELNIMESNLNLITAEHQLEKNRFLPDISLNWFQGSNSGLDDQLYGYQVGLKIPILFGGQASRVKAGNIAREAMNSKKQAFVVAYKSKEKEMHTLLNTYAQSLDYYETEGRAIAEELIRTARLSYRNGEINFFQYIASLENAYSILLERLEQLQRYNNTVIELKYLTLSE